MSIHAPHAPANRTIHASPDDAGGVAVCAFEDLLPERGVAALIEGRQVAIFRTHDGEVFAVQQLDPYSQAMVLSRGIVGSRGGRPTVASPMYKQVFDLTTGECLDPVGETPRSITTYAVRVVDGIVRVDAPQERESLAS